jgi:hypothetical protein
MPRRPHAVSGFLRLAVRLFNCRATAVCAARYIGAMQRYRDLSGTSGVTAYAIRPDAIDVQFAGGVVYTYTVASAGRAHIQQMKRLARSGSGLSTYISQHVRDAYADRRDPSGHS